jgi:hypothetical protein
MTTNAPAMTDEQLTEVLADLIKEYAVRAESDADRMKQVACWAERLNATETVRISVDLLIAAQVTSFELAAMFGI